jgi:hypothetical protein
MKNKKAKINWPWFNEYLKTIAVIIGTIFIITRIDLGVHPDNKQSLFLQSISPFLKSVIGDAVIVLFILLIALAYHYREELGM